MDDDPEPHPLDYERPTRPAAGSRMFVRGVIVGVIGTTLVAILVVFALALFLTPSGGSGH